MSDQPALPGLAAPIPIGDPLDRCYTPEALARAVVRALPIETPREVWEPSAGGGAFVRAIRERWPSARVLGVDVDPAAPARSLCNDWITGSWPEVARELARPPRVIVGNPPFGEALEHVEAALRFDTFVAFILPLAYLGVGAWQPLFAARPPARLRPITGRPWPARVRETAVYEWWGSRWASRPWTVEPLAGWP